MREEMEGKRRQSYVSHKYEESSQQFINHPIHPIRPHFRLAYSFTTIPSKS
ncbi:unnamed protein product, partial [Nesidiocoris tenuis]